MNVFVITCPSGVNATQSATLTTINSSTTTVHTWEIDIASNGDVTFYLDGAALTTVAGLWPTTATEATPQLNTGCTNTSPGFEIGAVQASWS